MLFESNLNLSIQSNPENDISLDIELNKTCFSKDEYIYGIIVLTPKINSFIKEFLNPYALISIQEKHNYEYLDSSYDQENDEIKPAKKSINEFKTLIKTQYNFSNYLNSSMIPCLKIQFRIKVPNNAYPSCLFDKNTFVIHYLTIEFESLKAKKSEIIIIKNSPYFTKENGLLKIPAVYKHILTKHKYVIFDCGYMEVKITLEKNICPYNENLPIEINIDCSKLDKIKVKGVKIYIYRSYKKNNPNNKKIIYEKKIEEIVRKTLPLREGEKTYHIEDGIKLPLSSNDLNPEEVYKILDKDKREPNLKFNNIKLYPSCNGGLLSCLYYITIVIETNTLFSTNEEIIIPIDFYSPFIPYEKEGNIKINISKSFNKKLDNKIILKKKEDNFEEKFNINQLIFSGDFGKKKEGKKSMEINKNKNDNDNSEGFEILPDDE